MADLIELYRHGQSVWLDFIDRRLITDGGLEDLVARGLRGVTTNPTIFHRAIAQTEAYDETIRDLLQADPQIGTEALYEWLAIEDVRMACDLLRPVYDSSDGADGFVSLEVSPHLAYDTEGTIAAARHLWKAVERPNLMIKVPATREGLPAIECLIGEGVNVNVTLLFSIPRYEAVAEAYHRGLSLNPEPARVASVASFFVSRIDTKVDALLEALGTPQARALKGKVAIASAKVAYRHYKRLRDAGAMAEHRRRGARPQRLLWGSTSTKNPDYPDVYYVDNLIGPETVNTLPPETLDAYLAHGEARATLELDVDQAEQTLAGLRALGIDLRQVTDELEAEGVRKFAESHDRLLAALQEKRRAVAKHYAE